MTCIIGLETPNAIYIAGDSAGADESGFSVTRRDGKVCRKMTGNNYDLLLGFSHSFRYGQLLKYKWDVPKYDESLDFNDYLHIDFIDSIYELLNDSYLDDKNIDNTELGSCIMSFNDRLFLIGSDLSVEQIDYNFSDFVAIGCGSDMAYGAMEALQHLEPETRLYRSLEIVNKYNPSTIRKPFTIEKLDKRTY